MGSIITAIGGALLNRKSSKKQQQTAATGFNYLANSPLAGYGERGGRASAAQANLLGIGGDPTAQRQAFDAFRGSTGYDFRLREGTNAITGNAAASGLLNSGSTLKALNKFGQNSASAEFGNYFSQLGGVADAGAGAVRTIGGAAESLGNNRANLVGEEYGGYGNAFGTLVGGVKSAFKRAKTPKGA